MAALLSAPHVSGAHPQMREVAIPLLREFKKRDPENFSDIQEDKA